MEIFNLLHGDIGLGQRTSNWSFRQFFYVYLYIIVYNYNGTQSLMVQNFEYFNSILIGCIQISRVQTVQTIILIYRRCFLVYHHWISNSTSIYCFLLTIICLYYYLRNSTLGYFLCFKLIILILECFRL